MASLHDASFYCITESELPSNGTNYWYRDAYAKISITSACVGLCGALWQLAIWRASTQRAEKSEIKTDRRNTFSRTIVVSLALANMMSCFGTISRTAALMMTTPPIRNELNISIPTVNNSTVIIGTVIEIFTNFSYTASVMWTLAFAIDVLAKLKIMARKSTDMPPLSGASFSLMCWGIPAITTMAGSLAIFVDSSFPGQCAGETRLIWRYTSYYSPVILVLLVNPIIYWRARKFKKQSILQTGSFTAIERNLLKVFTFKFSVIVAVYTIVWAPNIVDSIAELILLVQCSCKDKYKILFPLWVIEAILNPLQGLFNCILYKAHALYTCLCCQSRKRHVHDVQHERTSLLRRQ